MPVLPDPKHEKFAQCVARGLPVVEAYVRAGYKKNTGNATSLKKRPAVAKRIEELMQDYAADNAEALSDYLKESGINYTYIVKQMLDTAQLAKQNGKYNDAMNGFKEVGRELFSMFTEKKSVTVEQNVNHIRAEVSIQDVANTFSQLSRALEIPVIDLVAEPVNTAGTLAPVRSE